MNDTLTASNTVHCAFVTATKVGSSIERVDASEALKVPGVVGFYTAKDIPGKNSFVDTNFRYEDEELFTSGLVRYYDQPLGMIVAESSDVANRAAVKVKVIYSNPSQTKIMATMEDVLASREPDRIYNVVKTPLNDFSTPVNADISGRGILEIGLQYHFTMEPQTCVVIPSEQGLQVWSSTQWPDHTQAAIVKLLALKAALVQLKVRRIGGGFGGKTSRCNAVACAASLAAYKLNRPVRFVQTIESMMNCNGKRWACRSDYEFQVKADGKLMRLKNIFYQDAGWSPNENSIGLYALSSFRNCYEFPRDQLQLEGNAVLTDATGNAFFRAPGSLEGMYEGMLCRSLFADVALRDAVIFQVLP